MLQAGGFQMAQSFMEVLKVEGGGREKGGVVVSGQFHSYLLYILGL